MELSRNELMILILLGAGFAFLVPQVFVPGTFRLFLKKIMTQCEVSGRALIQYKENTVSLREKAKLLHDASLAGDEQAQFEISSNIKNQTWPYYGMFREGRLGIEFVAERRTRPSMSVVRRRDGTLDWRPSSASPLSENKD